MYCNCLTDIGILFDDLLKDLLYLFKAVPPSSHVQRFNYTRALFARMEEESKAQQERDKTVLLRRQSPVHGSRSSVVSPDRGLNDSSKSGPISDDTHFHKKLRLSDEGSDDQLDVHDSPRLRSPRSPRSDYKPPIPNRKPDLVNKPKPAYSEPNLTKAVSSSVSNTPGGLLWKRRQNDIMSDIANTDKFHESRNRHNLSSSSSQLETKMDSSETLDNSVFSNSNGSLTEDLSITSAYHSRKPHFPNDNVNFSQGRSASIEVLSSRSSDDHVGSRSVTRGHSENDDIDKQADKGGVVMRRTRLDKHAASQSTNPSKRLSREEIQAALERADTYLKSAPSDEGDSKAKTHAKENDMSTSDITSETSRNRESVPEHKMSQSDTSVETPKEGLRSWAMYRKQRYSRTSDHLDDKVGDVSNLGSISDISVSGFRKASMENLSKQSEPSSASAVKPSDAFAAISQSSVPLRRQLRSQQKQDSGQSADSVSQSAKPVEAKVSETNILVRKDGTGSGVNVTKSADYRDTSDHSNLPSSGVPESSRPIPVPRRSAPSPPVGPPPPLPSESVNSSHSPQTSPSVNHRSFAPPTEPPPPAPVPGLAEEVEEVSPVSKTSQSELLASNPPVPSIEPAVQMRNKAHFVSLEEPEETSDSEPVVTAQHRVG